MGKPLMKSSPIRLPHKLLLCPQTVITRKLGGEKHLGGAEDTQDGQIQGIRIWALFGAVYTPCIKRPRPLMQGRLSFLIPVP